MSVAHAASRPARPRATDASFLQAILGPSSSSARRVRQPDAPAAVDRRRVARQLRHVKPRRPSEDRDQRLAARMARRFHQGREPLDVLLLDVRYWQARRCGWDVKAVAWRTVGHDGRTGEPILCDPTDSPLWRWWTGLHHGNRGQLVRMSDFRLCQVASLPCNV